ncbi:putative phospholipid-transporting ATPase IF [Thelohanellus kitauei]|uniref:Putative phospholipid-transporting ATPase IF n=1 Tax=Thelohanellus kitauei TaxID=669202 RepID=A0A0C2M840_THEKT|nr:putative phospholipid-transporting ATPase IF [Thelohanellus kitauei]
MGVLMVEINSVVRKFTILHTLEFDSTRKKMSVVYRDENHDYYMVCKGADSHVIPVCVDSPYRTEISKQVNIFSVDGYRTLVYAFKKLTPKEFEQLSKVLHEAKVTVTDRENALEAAYNEVESGFTIVGATAVDDQLQDGVIDTVKDLRRAGIKVWVLTGDKEETAISISYKCGHLHPTMRILYLCERMHNLNSIIPEYIDAYYIILKEFSKIHMMNLPLFLMGLR